VRCRRHIAAAVLTLALALPSTALAQSAGDNQYQDPFEGQGGGGSTQQQQQQQQQSSGSQGRQQSAAPTTQNQAEQALPTAAQAQPAQTGALPRTGGQTPLLLAYGWTLVIAGTALRRASRRTT
jgi:hypothetical protein